MPSIQDTKILIMATDGFEQSELMVPLEKLQEAGAEVHIASPSETMEEGEICGWDETDWGDSVETDLTLDQVNVADYAALIIPGGQINPDKLRVEPKAVQLVKDFYNQGKVVAAICHGPWLLVESGVCKGKKVTSFKSIKTDLVNAGALWEDSEVVNEKGLITSRQPDDLDAFVEKIIEEVQEGNHAEKRKAA